MFPIPYQKLVEGAELCRDNAAMLAACASDIYGKSPNISSFLAVLALEEVAKGVALLKSYEKGKDFTKEEWSELTMRDAHRKKLEIVHEILVDPYSVLSPHDLSVKIGEIDKFRKNAEKIAKQIQRLKLACLYVDWNKKENRWKSPMKEHVFTEPIFQQLVASIHILSQKIREVN